MRERRFPYDIHMYTNFFLQGISIITLELYSISLLRINVLL